MSSSEEDGVCPKCGERTLKLVEKGAPAGNGDQIDVYECSKCGYRAGDNTLSAAPIK